MKHRSAERGTTLIEILVVIVILLVGIFAFVRLLPTGFFILQQSGEAGNAGRLAQSELERLKAQPQNLASAILPVKFEQDAQGNWGQVIDMDAEPDRMVFDDSYLPAYYRQYATGANRFRAIRGERVNVPLPGPTNVGLGCVYMTSFAPVVEDLQGAVSSNLLLYSDPMRRNVMEYDTSRFPRLRPFEYGIDYDEAKILLRPRADFAVSYKIDFAFYQQVNGAVTVVFSQQTALLNPTGNPRITAVWGDLEYNGQPVTTVPGFIGIVPDSDVAARLFDRLGNFTAWAADYPYQYKVVNHALGLVIMNPAASGYYERYGNGLRPLRANVDYIVRDWRIIREDRQVPNRRIVKLTFSNVKKSGDLQNDQTTYAGLAITPDGQLISGTEDVLIINTEDGGVAKSGYQVDYRTGEVRFDQNVDFVRVRFDNNTLQRMFEPYTADLNAQTLTLRFLYRVENDWAMSAQKSTESFTPSYSPAINFDQCYISDSSPQLFFRLCEAGKTVVLREYFYRDDKGNIHRAANGIFKITNNPALYQTNGAIRLAPLDLRERHPNAVAWAPEPTGLPVRGVQGVSLRVRMSWQPPGQRIKRQDFDTLLVREQ